MIRIFLFLLTSSMVFGSLFFCSDQASLPQSVNEGDQDGSEVYNNIAGEGITRLYFTFYEINTGFSSLPSPSQTTTTQPTQTSQTTTGTNTQTNQTTQTTQTSQNTQTTNTTQNTNQNGQQSSSQTSSQNTTENTSGLPSLPGQYQLTANLVKGAMETVDAEEIKNFQNCFAPKAYFIAKDLVMYRDQDTNKCITIEHISARHEEKGKDIWLIKDRFKVGLYRELASVVFQHDEKWSIRRVLLPTEFLDANTINLMDLSTALVKVKEGAVETVVDALRNEGYVDAAITLAKEQCNLLTKSGSINKTAVCQLEESLSQEQKASADVFSGVTDHVGKSLKAIEAKKEKEGLFDALYNDNSNGNSNSNNNNNSNDNQSSSTASLFLWDF